MDSEQTLVDEELPIITIQWKGAEVRFTTGGGALDDCLKAQGVLFQVATIIASQAIQGAERGRIEKPIMSGPLPPPPGSGRPS
jgi:hypothetical protein